MKKLKKILPAIILVLYTLIIVLIFSDNIEMYKQFTLMYPSITISIFAIVVVSFLWWYVERDWIKRHKISEKNQKNIRFISEVFLFATMLSLLSISIYIKYGFKTNYEWTVEKYFNEIISSHSSPNPFGPKNVTMTSIILIKLRYLIYLVRPLYFLFYLSIPFVFGPFIVWCKNKITDRKGTKIIILLIFLVCIYIPIYMFFSSIFFGFHLNIAATNRHKNDSIKKEIPVPTVENVNINLGNLSKSTTTIFVGKMYIVDNDVKLQLGSDGLLYFTLRSDQKQTSIKPQFQTVVSKNSSYSIVIESCQSEWFSNGGDTYVEGATNCLISINKKMLN